jgi:hypothetical protein
MECNWFPWFSNALDELIKPIYLLIFIQIELKSHRFAVQSAFRIKWVGAYRAV